MAESVCLEMGPQPDSFVSGCENLHELHIWPTRITAFVVAFEDCTPLSLGLEGTFSVAIFLTDIKV